MMLIGFGLAGGLLRRRHRPLPLGTGVTPKPFPLRISKRLKWVAAGEGGVLMADAGSTVAFATSPAGSAALTKALLCVCPVAVMAAAATTVPPVRDAVHSATAPAAPSSALAPQIAVPCDPVAAAQRSLIKVAVPDPSTDPSTGPAPSPAPTIALDQPAPDRSVDA